MAGPSAMPPPSTAACKHKRMQRRILLSNADQVIKHEQGKQQLPPAILAGERGRGKGIGIGKGEGATNLLA